MKYQIDTIPLWDALDSQSECPLCTLNLSCEQQYVQAAIGAAVMEPESRMITNQKGFCARHFEQMSAHSERLPLALMTHTHMLDIQTTLSKQWRQMDTELDKADARKLPDISGIGHNTPYQRAAREAANVLEQRLSTCAICDQLQNTMDRYLYTLIHMVMHDRDFAARFESSSGLCLPHYAQALRCAADEFSGSKLRTFLRNLNAQMRTQFARTSQDLEAFTLQFDYRNAGKPTQQNVRGALGRAMQRLKGQPLAATKDPAYALPEPSKDDEYEDH